MNNQEKKVNGNPVGRFFKQRKLRYGGLSILLTAVVIAVVILFNIAVGAVERNWGLRIDLTSSKVTDFNEQTYQLVGDLTQPVHIYAIFSTGNQSAGRIQMEEVLTKYRTINRNVTVDFVDPALDPMTINKYASEGVQLREGTLFVVNESGTRVKTITPDQYNTTTPHPLNPEVQIPLFAAERRITSAINYVTSEVFPVVRVLSGHNEAPLSAYSVFLKGYLEDNSYEMADLNLASEDAMLNKGDVLLIVSPSRDIPDSEYEKIRAWLTDGGRLLIAMDYQIDMTHFTNINRLLSYYSLSFGEGYIVEDTNQPNNWYGNTYLLVPNKDPEHQVTKNLGQSYYMLLPQVRPINPLAMPESGIQYATLLFSSEAATVRTADGVSDPGKQIIAMTALKQDYENQENDVRIAMIGTSAALVDSEYMGSSYNGLFALQLFEWLINREEQVNFSAKLVAQSMLRIPDAATGWTLAAIVVVIIPLMIAAAGVIVWIRRRRL